MTDTQQYHEYLDADGLIVVSETVRDWVKTRSPLGHTHPTTDIVSGILGTARGGTGVATVAGTGTQKRFLASPASATAASPSFQTIAVADVPTLNQDSTGNSATATKLATPRTIALSADATGSAIFDGTTNATIPVTLTNVPRSDTTVAVVPGYSGTFTAIDALSTDSKGRVFATNLKTITMPPEQTTIIGNSGSATKLQTARALNVSGDVIGTAQNFDGTSAVTIPTVLANVTRTDTTSTASPAYGATFTALDSLTTDSKGRVTGANTKTVTVPSVNNTLTSTSTTAALTAAQGKALNDKIIAIQNADYQNSAQVQDAIDHTMGEYIGGFIEVVASLPAVGELGKIYLVPSAGAQSGAAVEYIWDGTQYERIGTMEADLTEYVKKTTTINSKALTGNITLTPTDIGAPPTDHASTATTYGVSSASNYGHAKFGNAAPSNDAATASAGTDNGLYAASNHAHQYPPQLLTARTFQTNLASTATASFNGTANATPGVTGVLPTANGGTGNTTGQSPTATQLATARTLSLSTDATGSASFDGSANATIPVTLANVTRTNTTSAAAPAYGATFTALDGLTTDAKGRVTGANTKTVTIPAAQTAITGNASTATTLATARTIAISGKATGTATSFDGSANISIPITALTIAVADVPTLNQSTTGNAATATALATARTISLTGDATGSANFNGTANAAIAATLATVATAGTAGEAANRTLAFGGTFVVPQVTINAKGLTTAATARTLTLPAAPTTITGNAATATTLATARTIQTNLASTTAASFNGSANVTPGVTGTLPVANGGTGLTAAPSLLTNLASTTAASPLTATPRPGVTGTLPVANGGTGNTTGQAATALTLATARTIALSGKAVGTATSFNGSGNITIPVTSVTDAATLTTARTIQTNLASTATASFNGSANVAPGVTGTLPIANGGTGATTAAAAATNLAVLPVTRNTTAPTGTTRYNCEGYLYATRLYGSVYQDYAECRKGVTASEHTPGRWYRDENGTLHDKKPGRYSNAFIMSDTFGQLIGVSDENSIPVALSGRVLAYVDNKAELKSGDVLGTSKRNRGALSKLNRLERILHPEWIVGTVSEIPSYPKWNGIRVDGRVWVNVR